MEKLVWCKVKQFLEELRSEDTDRESRVETCEFQTAERVLLEKKAGYQQAIAGMHADCQEKVKDYVEALKECAFEECQQSYLQGMLDGLLVLCGSGILKPRKEVEEVLKAFRQP